MKYFLQRVFRGWDDRETWDFENSFLHWILPRLIRYSKIYMSYPANYTEEEWESLIQHYIQEITEILELFKNEDNLPLDEVEQLFNKRHKLVEELGKNLYNLYW